MKTKNILRMLLVAAVLLLGANNVKAADVWTEEISTTFTIPSSNFSNLSEGDVITVYASITNTNNWGIKFYFSDQSKSPDFTNEDIWKWGNVWVYQGFGYDSDEKCFKVTCSENTVKNIKDYGLTIEPFGITISQVTIGSDGPDNVFAVRTTAKGPGTLTASPESGEAGTVVTLTATPNNGYVLQSLTATDANGNNVTITNNTFTLQSKVNVTAIFAPTTDGTTLWTGYFEHGSWASTLDITDNIFASIAVDDKLRFYGISGDSWAYNINNGKSGQLAYKAGDSSVNYIEFDVTEAMATDLKAAVNGIYAKLSANNFTLTAITLLAATKYGITVDENITGGTVTASKSSAMAGDAITLTVTPDTGYRLGSLTVKDANNNDVTVENNAFTMPASAVSITATFNLNTYTLTYTVDDVTVKTEDLAPGATPTPPAAPEKEGYRFEKWENLPETMPSQNVIAWARFAINSYKLNWVVDGQTVQSDNYNFGAQVYAFNAPTKDGFIFSGWNEDIPTTMPAHDVTITGSYYSTSAIMWTVDSNTPTAAGSTLIDNAYLTASTVFATKSSNESNAINLAGQNVQNGFQLRVNKAPSADAVTGTEQSESTPLVITPKKNVEVTFYYRRQQGDNFSANDSKDLKVVDQQNPTTLLNGSLNIDSKTDDNAYGYATKTYILEAGKTYTVFATGTTMRFFGLSYAVSTGMKYTLTYILDGTTYRSLMLEEGAAIPYMADPYREGSTFSGWTPAVPQTMPGNDLTVSGSFNVNKHTLTYMVNEEVYKTYEVETGAAITLETAPEIEGYEFLKWINEISTMPDYDWTMTAQYQLRNYTLTWMVDGEVYQTATYAYGADVYTVQDPYREGYTFSGWSGIPETMPAHDVTITGSFGAVAYTITGVNATEGIISADRTFGNVGDVVTLTVTPSTGYELERIWVTRDDWNSAVELTTVLNYSTYTFTMPASTVTVHATFVASNGFKVNTSVTSGYGALSTNKASYAYGETVTLTPNPAVGYHFESISSNDVTLTDNGNGQYSFTMPAENVNVTATFAVNYHTLTYMVDGEQYGDVLSYPYGATITPASAPTPTEEGQEFSGWSEIPSTMPDMDLVVYGYFSSNATITVGAHGFATYSNSRPLNFSNVTGIKAYIARRVSNNQVELVQVVGSCAAGTGLVIIGNQGTYTIPVASAGTDYSSQNLLKAVLSGETINASTDYVLTWQSDPLVANSQERVVFAATTVTPATIPAGHAYLKWPQGSNSRARALTITFSDSTTGIGQVETELTGDEVIYNLRGQRVEKPGKGLYIVNGKKVFIK